MNKMPHPSSREYSRVMDWKLYAEIEKHRAQGNDYGVEVLTDFAEFLAEQRAKLYAHKVDLSRVLRRDKIATACVWILFTVSSVLFSVGMAWLNWRLLHG